MSDHSVPVRRPVHAAAVFSDAPARGKGGLRWAGAVIPAPGQGLNFHPVGWSTDSGLPRVFAAAGTFCRMPNAPVPLRERGQTRAVTRQAGDTVRGFGADACARPA